MTDTRPAPLSESRLRELADQVKVWGRELGFQQIAITDTGLERHQEYLQAWLDKGYHGDMQWMAQHGTLRSRPADLLEGTLRVISARMDYLPGDTRQIEILKSPDKAYVSRYALGRDYHKLIRKRLSQLAAMLDDASGAHPSQRAFVDSAPVLERALAEKAGLGWIGKNTLLINACAGSWFFLGEIYTSLPLPVDQQPQANQCGTCSACLKVCPTDAFTGPYQLDARRCISYLTIEYAGVIPEEFRSAMGNRVFGCDDCQAICPWNKFAAPTAEADFSPRHQLDRAGLLELFNWSEAEFLRYTEGSPIRRIGYERWQRNLAIGLGNAPADAAIQMALSVRLASASPLLQEHLQWALQQQQNPGRRPRKIRRADRDS